MSKSSVPNGSTPRQSPAIDTSGNVALYMRVSSEDQAERGTIGAQRDFLRQFAKLYSLSIIEEYEDDGVTGTLPISQRGAGRRLLDDARQGRFGCVLVYRVDRLGRSLTALLEAHTVLSQAGITIRSATEPFDTSTSIGTFLFQLLGSLAELEKATITERMSLGRDRTVRNGAWPGGVIPFGYALDHEGHLVPSPFTVADTGMTEADFVKDMFQRIANGSTAVGECQRLNNLGIVPTRRYAQDKVIHLAKMWYPSRLSRMLKNPVYIGEHTFKSRYGAITQPSPVLIDHDTWRLVGKQLTQNRRFATPPHVRQYLLRGLIRCGNCGSTYTGQAMVKPSRHYYRCRARDPLHAAGKRCKGRSLRAERLEELIWDECRRYLEDPGEALEEARTQLRERQEKTHAVEYEQQRIQAALAEKAEERERILSLFRRGRITVSDVDQQLDAIERETNALQLELRSIKAQADVTEAFEAYYLDAKNLLISLRYKVANLDFETKQHVVRLLVSGITVTTQADGTTSVLVTYTFNPKRVLDFPML